MLARGKERVSAGQHSSHSYMYVSCAGRLTSNWPYSFSKRRRRLMGSFAASRLAFSAKGVFAISLDHYMTRQVNRRHFDVSVAEWEVLTKSMASAEACRDVAVLRKGDSALWFGGDVVVGFA